MVFPQPILQCVVEKPRYTAACEGVYKKLSTLCTRLSPGTLWKVLWIKWIASFCDRFLQRYPAEGEWQPKLGSVVRRTHGGGHRVDTKVSTFVNPVSFIPNLVKIREAATAPKRERQRIFFRMDARCAPCIHIFAGSDTVLLHRPAALRRRSIIVPRNPLAGYNARHLRVTLINRLYRRVRRLGAPSLTKNIS